MQVSSQYTQDLFEAADDVVTRTRPDLMENPDYAAKIESLRTVVEKWKKGEQDWKSLERSLHVVRASGKSMAATIYQELVPTPVGLPSEEYSYAQLDANRALHFFHACNNGASWPQLKSIGSLLGPPPTSKKPDLSLEFTDSLEIVCIPTQACSWQSLVCYQLARIVALGTCHTGADAMWMSYHFKFSIASAENWERVLLLGFGGRVFPPDAQEIITHVIRHRGMMWNRRLS
jgi:hypothetical protein